MVLDPNVFYFYWSDTLTNNVNDAKPVLEFLKTRRPLLGSASRSSTRDRPHR